MAEMESKGKKRNFSEAELEVLVSEVDERKAILFGGHSSGITNKNKYLEWQHITAAVNAVASANRTLPDVKKKWSDLKVGVKKRLASHRQSVCATGRGKGAPDLSPMETRMASILGQTSVCGIVSEREGDTDVLDTGEPESAGAQSDETPSAESAGAMEFPEVPSTSASRLYGTAGSGRVLTEAVLQTQRDTINAVTVIADELKQIRVVLGDIASTLKDLVKK
ncbi:nuclear apoptosis-inducing factor 1-like isoform X2 [Carassius carassius]|uniref:nuclear apoptosis-inducing factor 1-like isoform X2 n=1 Tax=Carassius carassius TaxID=217509 RepID=UPI002868889F|nr:nuclear apoptosis-inducing factor 1-like isoform X2 [Carassius carassius]